MVIIGMAIISMTETIKMMVLGGIFFAIAGGFEKSKPCRPLTTPGRLCGPHPLTFPAGGGPSCHRLEPGLHGNPETLWVAGAGPPQVQVQPCLDPQSYSCGTTILGPGTGPAPLPIPYLPMATVMCTVSAAIIDGTGLPDPLVAFHHGMPSISKKSCPMFADSRRTFRGEAVR